MQPAHFQKSAAHRRLYLILASLLAITALSFLQHLPTLARELQTMQPPPPEQGGDCITGAIVDRYDQPVGAGWQVMVSPSQGQALSQSADEQGQFTFDGIAGGQVELSLEIPQGWQAFTPAIFPVTLSGNGDACADVRFRVDAFTCLDMYMKDSRSDTGLAGWEISIKTGDLTTAGITDGTGWVRFSSLTPGSYILTVRPKEGWQTTSELPQTLELQPASACPVVTLESQPADTQTQPESAGTTAPAETVRSSCRLRYHVQAGDTLYSIAERYHSTVKRLVKANKIHNPSLIFPGQSICIPRR